MVNALVIKNANFLANKVTTVTIAIPCNNIKFDETSVTLNSLGAAEIGYTVTPDDTTDSIVISSSNSSVISVNSSNELVVNGIGQCTLTITCGSHSDTCSITVNIYETPLFINAATSSAADPDHEGVNGYSVNLSSKSKLVCLAPHSRHNFNNTIDFLNGERPSYVDVAEAIKLPANANYIHVYARNLYDDENVAFIRFLDPETKFIRNSNSYTKILSTVNMAEITRPSGVYTLDQVVSVPSGATGYMMDIIPAGNDIYSIDTQSGLQNLAYNTMSLSIHYLATNSTT